MPSAIGSSTNTTANQTSYSDTAANANKSDYPGQYSAEAQETDHATGEQEFSWNNNNWTEYLGYYKAGNAMVSGAIDKMALWTVGQGFKPKGSNALTRFFKGKKLGIGKDTLTGIFYNLDRTSQIAGDAFAEIIKDSSGRLINLKPINPGNLSVIFDKYGRVKRYEQTETKQKFSKDKIFHITNDRIADEIHGISVYEKLKLGIDMQTESKKDIKLVFHRYVKPLIITEVDEDDESKIAAFKTKLDTAFTTGENLIIPKGTASIERVSIPQYSTLDPIPWITYLDKNIVRSQGVPMVILGASGEEDTEASSKIIYLAFEQLIKFRQMLWEENVKNQLGIEIKFEFPASIAPSLLADANKDGNNGGATKPDKINPAKQSQ